ncbi:MAG: hypothetical protein AAFO69_12345 [Bacteroidota bacterium]
MRHKLSLSFFFFSFFLLNCVEEPLFTSPPEMQILRLVEYGDHPLQNMDIYLPENRTAKTKVVIMIHGGGWVTGYSPEAEVTTFSGRYNWDIMSPLLDQGYALTDQLVPATQANAMYEAMQSRFPSGTCPDTDFSCQLKKGIYDHCDHGWTGRNCTRDLIMNDIIDWINAH